MINKLIIDTLKPLKVPVVFMVYDGSKNTYIVFSIYNQKGESYAEDKEITTGFYIQISIYSKENYNDLVKEVKDLLEPEGFFRLNEYDLYESDTGFYHHVIRFFYAKNN